MGSGGKFDFRQVEKLKKQIEQLERQKDSFNEGCAKYLAQRLLAKVVKRTPVGDYSVKEVAFDVKLPERKVRFSTKSGKEVSFTAKAQMKHVKFTPKSSGMTGGTLRRGWTKQAFSVAKVGSNYIVTITNPTDYASYVEYGHRTSNHKGWVKGKFMMTISERELQEQAPKMIEARVAEYLKGVFSC